MKVSLADRCTCNSGRRIIDCCYRDVETRPPDSPTGFMHRRCFARGLADCSQKLSKEHFFSKSVTVLFAESVRVRAPFLKGESKSLNVGALSARVLCERHNNALSPLDDFARRFFEFSLARTSQEFLICRGTVLERWLLKVMCGAIASGQGRTSRGTLLPKDTPPPLTVLKTLFGASELEAGSGLAIPAKDNVVLRDDLGFELF